MISHRARVQAKAIAGPGLESEQVLPIALNDYIVALGGQSVRLVDASTVRATHSDGGELVVDDQNLVYTSADRYFGPASITVEVTDGTSDRTAADATSRSSCASLKRSLAQTAVSARTPRTSSMQPTRPDIAQTP